MEKLTALILAAGQGTRMKSKYPKVLHPLLGEPMLRYVTDAARAAGAERIAVVIGFEGERVQAAMGPELEYIWQREQLGTGHAVLMAREFLAKATGELLVLYGDTPLIKPETLCELIELQRATGAAGAILTTRMQDPAGYGRIIRNTGNEISGIVEHKDASSGERIIDEVNTGIYCFTIAALREALAELTPQNAQGEYYLTDVFAAFIGNGLKVAGLLTGDAEAVMGPNDRAQLARTEAFLREAINQRWMAEGVSIPDPATAYIGPHVRIGRDTTVFPGTFIFGKTVIGSDCVIGPQSRIVDSTIGDNTEVQYSQVFQAELGPQNNIGPYSFVRQGTVTAARVKIGGFVEVKNVRIAEESKVPHLSYMGDAEVGRDVNIGAGTITCNYDGVSKHRTIIEDEVFIGSNTNLVAPVTVRAGATVAAGSTITKEVPAKALGIARARQENLTEWVSPKDRAGK
jgi:bifunctional UDP-N-acetylglucosamine pyrophosphorylase/glucosamine-1-phosphate N-acetyltransferase